MKRPLRISSNVRETLFKEFVTGESSGKYLIPFIVGGPPSGGPLFYIVTKINYTLKHFSWEGKREVGNYFFSKGLTGAGIEGKKQMISGGHKAAMRAYGALAQLFPADNPEKSAGISRRYFAASP